MIRIDAIRELRRDLHMRPFESDRRVYLLHRAHLMNEDAADALLKDLESAELRRDRVDRRRSRAAAGHDPLPLPAGAVPAVVGEAIRALVDARAPQLDADSRAALARVAAGRLDRLERLLDPASVARREALIDQARAVYGNPLSTPRMRRRSPRERAGPGHGSSGPRGGDHRRARADRTRSRAAGEAAARGAEREELLAQLEELAPGTGI